MGLISRVSSRTYRRVAKMTKIITRTHNCHCTVESSKVEAKFTNMRLTGGIRVKVDQKMKITVPLKADCECHEVGAPAPKLVEQTQVTASPKPTQKPAVIPPKPRLSASQDDVKLTVFINARHLPKMDSFVEGGSCDPYYNFFLDQGQGFKKVSGGPHLALKNQRKGAWSFNILKTELLKSLKMKIEFWDVDSTNKDDFIGDFVCDAKAFLASGGTGFKDAKLQGKAAKNSVIDLTYQVAK